MFTRILIAGALALSTVSQVSAHDWYPPYCCNGEDCKPLRAKDVWFNSELGLWQFVDQHGKQWTVPKDVVRSDDENPTMNASACVLWGRVRCFWKPRGGI